ncbi:cupin domain-containing protein [Arsenicicoccus piscis]|uniref:JmjC domain-containing protein n=1 Tax=Arsenicicoccus piscis TaxID=673954 RepID=A0ABQ6HPE8_9MICO|nr:cupin domain-containing protein [Arsenicicoccus piscis]MCH8629104.1 cupin domain-containing protein [Arsenicicoccus piscis]GMA20338.1 hypothetical protein GCM10025862_23590 [Arsenicicoccus piscis]
MGPQRERPALRRLVGPHVEDFASSTWGSRPLLVRAADLPQPFDDLFGPDAIDELVSRRGLRTPFLRVAKDGSALPDRAFTRGGGVGAGVTDQVSDDDLLALFADGATLVGQGLHRTWPPLLELGQQLTEDLGHPVQINAYITPPQNQGFAAHYDIHDVFVLQTSGSKAWRIHEPVHPAPLRSDPWDERRAEVAEAALGEPVIDTVLEPGDCLYLPRGFLHSAKALGQVSSHVTIGVHSWTVHEVAHQLSSAAMSRLGRDEQIRRSLPLGADLSTAEAFASTAPDVFQQAKDALLQAISELEPADVAAALARRDRSSTRTSPVSPVAQVQAALDLTDHSRVRLRPHLQLTVAPDAGAGSTGNVSADRLRLSSRVASLVVESGDVDRAGLDRLLDGAVVTAAELGVGVTRELLRRGVVVPA